MFGDHHPQSGQLRKNHDHLGISQGDVTAIFDGYRLPIAV